MRSPGARDLVIFGDIVFRVRLRQLLGFRFRRWRRWSLDWGGILEPLTGSPLATAFDGSGRFMAFSLRATVGPGIHRRISGRASRFAAGSGLASGRAWG